MQQVGISAVPNQTISVTLDTDFYDIGLHLVGNGMCATVFRNNVRIVSAARIVANFPIIPYQYLQTGNLVVTSLNDEIPYYTEFGVSQFLVYYSAAEFAALVS